MAGAASGVALEKLEMMLQNLQYRVSGLERFELEIAGESWDAERLESWMKRFVCGY
jgi:hypothetical protein